MIEKATAERIQKSYFNLLDVLGNNVGISTISADPQV